LKNSQGSRNPAQGDEPHRLANNLAIIQCAWIMRRLEKSAERKKKKTFSDKPTRTYVSFFCDDSEQYSPFAHAAYGDLYKNNPTASAYMASYSEGDDKQYNVLQRADAFVYEVRRSLNLSLKQRDGDVRKQYRMLADAKRIYIITKAGKEELRNIVTTNKPGDPISLDAIMEMHVDKDIKFGISGF